MQLPKLILIRFELAMNNVMLKPLKSPRKTANFIPAFFYEADLKFKMTCKGETQLEKVQS